MIHKAKDLSPDQKLAIESLLGRQVAEDEAISIRTLTVDDVGSFANATSVPAPEWLQTSWDSAKRLKLDGLSLEEIDAEIDAARKVRRNPALE